MDASEAVKAIPLGEQHGEDRGQSDSGCHPSHPYQYRHSRHILVRRITFRPRPRAGGNMAAAIANARALGPGRAHKDRV